MLEIHHLKKSFTINEIENIILENIILKVNERESIAIIGPSGSGKSTLLGLLAGLDIPTSGSILIDGKDFLMMSEDAKSEIRNTKMGYIFQNFELIPHLNAWQNVALPAQIAGRFDEIEAKKLLKEVGLAERLEAFPSTLSGGEKQRVAIARSFINNPQYILADEPTGNLDEKNSALVMELLQDQVKQKGATLILITHDQKWANTLDHCYLLSNGVLIQQ